MPHDPNVDAYIARSAPFTRPILEHLRALVHGMCPEVAEAIKWGRPFFLLDGRALAMMAAFKAHASFGFWRGGGMDRGGEGAGDFGKLVAIGDLPDDAALRSLIGAAAERLRSGPPPRRAAAPTPPLPVPDDLAAVLEGSAAALATFSGLAPGQRREYLAWIGAAKRSATRAGRIATAVARLAEGETLNGRYRR